jgi:hypothetical protein
MQAWIVIAIVAMKHLTINDSSKMRDKSALQARFVLPLVGKKITKNGQIGFSRL